MRRERFCGIEWQLYEWKKLSVQSLLPSLPFLLALSSSTPFLSCIQVSTAYIMQRVVCKTKASFYVSLTLKINNPLP